eukprot:TRINITY_DN7890_c0_g2_i1.p1 TRINITY_DN7890_c0_g2~~TRINITY_DN7890_c0_g2_i1.p1  ORF type:complete len:457 (-),score=95.20 TRINITY_DN7890_c0_g2_i1:294-1664(-)
MAAAAAAREGDVKTGFQAKAYFGMSGDVVELGSFSSRDLDKDDPPSVTAIKLKKKLCELHGPMFAVLLREGDEHALTNEELCELEEIGSSSSQGVGFRIVQRPLPDEIFVLADIGGDEGCPRVCAQEVSVKKESYATLQEAKAVKAVKRWKKISLKAMKKDSTAMAKLTDHVFVLLKVKTDMGHPGHPYAQWARHAFVDEESAAQSARKLYRKSLWAEDSESSDDGDDSKGKETRPVASSGIFGRSQHEGDSEDLGFASDDSDCGDYTKDLSKMNDDMVIFNYCTSIRIRKVMLPITLPEEPAPAQDQDAALVGDWVSDKGTCRILKDPTTDRLAFEEPFGDGERLYGFLEQERGANLLWQASLGILGEGQDPSFGSSEVAGRILVRLLPEVGETLRGSATKASMEMQIHVDGEEESVEGADDDDDESWEPPVKFRRVDVAVPEGKGSTDGTEVAG